MQRTRGGFTIIEVLVVLAISLVLFFAAVTLFAGRQGTAQFAQAMRDVASQIQSIVNDVGVSTYPDASNYTCDVVLDGETGQERPRLISGSTPTGTSEKCMFLGKAIFIDTNNDPDPPDKFQIYTVLGRRLANGTPVTNIADTNPEAINGPPSADNLTETYTIPFGATVLSAFQDVAPTDTATYLMGFYNSLQPTGVNIAQGSQSITTYGYVGINANAFGQVKNAIRSVKDGPVYAATTVNESRIWTICFQSGTSNETAQIIVNSSSAGVTTEVKYTVCS